MKILQINASYKPAFIYGGPTMSVSMLCEQLVNAGCEVQVYTTTANGNTELPVTPNKPQLVDSVNVIYFKRISKDHSHFSPALLKAVWQNVKQYDAVHIHAWWNLVSVLSCLIAVFKGVPVLVSPRGTLSAYSFQNKNKGIKAAIHNLLGKPVLKRCHIHVTSNKEADAVNSVINFKSISILPNFVKLPKQKLSAQHQSSPVFKLIFFSRIEEKKGLDILLNALVLIDMPFHLTIAGSGNDAYVNKLKALAISNNIADKITWTGLIGDEKFKVLQQHDLFVLPSHDENFGNAVIESLSVGTPVLISTGVGLADYVLQNKLGWVCQTNKNSVADALKSIFQQQEMLAAIREQAPGIINNDFDTNHLVKKYISLYNNIIRKN